jgi:D-3-phosphoglycerate dehydrogenase
MRVLVADKLPESSLEEMRVLGCDVRYEPGAGADDLPGLMEQVGVLVVRGKEVGERVIAAGDALNLIIRAGAGVNNIEVGAASRRGIYVANCPGKNASAVAELTMTLIGCLDRRVPDAIQSLRQGAWNKNEYARARGLRGRSIGIIGLGHVGRAVLRLAQAFGMRAAAFSRSLGRQQAEELGVARAPTLEELARASEILTLHCELTPRTRGIVGKKVLDALPDGAFLVNTARAELVDHDALVEAVRQKGVRVALDVLPAEPGSRDASYSHPLLSAGVVYATPHIGASTDEAQAAIAEDVVRILRSFLSEGVVPNVVNICAASPARYQLVVRHLDRVGVLANVLGVLKRHGINVEELDNTVFDGAKAACCKLRLASRPSDDCLNEIRAFRDEVLHVDLVQLPNLA